MEFSRIASRRSLQIQGARGSFWAAIWVSVWRWQIGIIAEKKDCGNKSSKALTTFWIVSYSFCLQADGLGLGLRHVSNSRHQKDPFWRPASWRYSGEPVPSCRFQVHVRFKFMVCLHDGIARLCYSKFRLWGGVQHGCPQMRKMQQSRLRSGTICKTVFFTLMS